MTTGDREYITYKSRRQGADDNIFHSESEEEENMGDMNEWYEGNTMSILNDLGREKQQLVQLLTHFITNSQGNQNNVGNNGLGGINSNNGNHIEERNTHILA